MSKIFSNAASLRKSCVIYVTNQWCSLNSRDAKRIAELGEAGMNSTWASEWQKYWVIRVLTYDGVIDLDHYDTL